MESSGEDATMRYGQLELIQKVREETGCAHDLRLSENIATGGMQFIHDYDRGLNISDMERGLAADDEPILAKIIAFVKEAHPLAAKGEKR